ncbi:WDR11 [Cordylochernes scorpioides]|uniref:WDR11 n=1 Tax=Cordylochernes scorpioides TaxID=51811 RepID=A0ABY6LJS8_9ARAC|nr:WDR11 [Cordylochernes scorpioides]
MSRGWQSLVAYGCNNHLFQSLKKHKADVVKVRWSQESHHHDTFNPYSLVLASGDASGKIVVWDVKQGVARKTMSEGNKPVAEMEWVTGASDGCHHLLTALHPPATLVVWNTETGQPLWRKVYTGEHLQSFSFDPFTSSNLACECNNMDKYRMVQFKSISGTIDLKMAVRVSKMIQHQGPFNIEDEAQHPAD